MHSPFSYDNIASEDNFFARNDELKRLDKIVKYSNNFLLFSKRRMGKTTLIKHFISTKQSEYICIYVDIFDITSKEDFASKLLNSLANSHNQDIKTTIKKLTNLFKRVRVEPTIDPQTLEYSIKPIVTTLSFEEMMDDFFNSIDKLSKNQKIIIAIDEFQQISTIKDIKLDAYMRRYIQEREDTSYIFLGSKRHLLTSLFSYKAPLFELAQHYELQALDIDEAYSYIKKHIDINMKLLEYLYERCDGETKLLLEILHNIYINKEHISNEMIDITLKNILNSKDTTFRMLFDTLSNNQKIAIKIVVHHKKGVFSQTILQNYNIKKQTLQSAIEKLLLNELIDKNENGYFIPDRSFELWLQHNSQNQL
jgi:AAA+ ATPase superfamily predicted ATPase